MSASVVRNSEHAVIKDLLKEFLKSNARGKWRSTRSKIIAEPLGISKSRTKSYILRCTLESPKGEKLKTFVKISPITHFAYDPLSPHKNVMKLSRQDNEVVKFPTVAEIKYYKMTNILTDKGICDTFAYCYNKKIVKKKKEIFYYGGRYFSFLFMEQIRGINLRDYILSGGGIPDDLIFQVIYTLSCMEHINFRHMDLHFNNIYVVDTKKGTDKYVTPYGHANVSNHGRKIKIIDLDGSVKLRPNRNIIKDFQFALYNTGIPSGKSNFKTTNPRIDLMKFIFELERTYKARHLDVRDLKTQLRFMRITSNEGVVPLTFHKKGIKGLSQTEHHALLKNVMKNFGILMKAVKSKNGDTHKLNVLNFDDKIINKPSIILKELLYIYNNKNTVYNNTIQQTYDQRKLFK